MKLVEELSGSGELMRDGSPLGGVRYHVRRFQAMMPQSGLPIPGLHRIEGAIEATSAVDFNEWISIPLELKLEDGRLLRVILQDREGRILTEGHGPSRCLCC